MSIARLGRSNRMNAAGLICTLAGKIGLSATLLLVAGTVVDNFAAAQGQTAAAESRSMLRNTKEWNVSRNKLAIDGYDPVAYFPEGGGTAKKGQEQLETEYEGVKYRFASAANREKFLADPARYEPAHGGWCSWAMQDGDKVEVDPKSFIVKDGRLFLFYKGLLGDTRAKWLKGDHAAEAGKADGSWKKTSGESVRVPMTLGARLSAKRAEFDAKAPKEKIELFEQGIRDVQASGVTERALKVGQSVPDFELADATGKTVSFALLRAAGPVVVTFYRGGWCPYCNLQLHAYQEAMEEIAGAGGSLVAISPQTPDHSLTTAEKNALAFPVLSDPGNRVAKMFGLAYKLPDSIAPVYRQVGLEKYNGDSSEELPLSATYVVDRAGKVAYAFVVADYRERAEPGAIVEALRKLAN